MIESPFLNYISEELSKLKRSNLKKELCLIESAQNSEIVFAYFEEITPFKYIDF